jgi:5'-phosphate synthase pdxT subunit
VRVGILALQGGVAPHARALSALGHQPVLVRAAADLDRLAGLVLPGGESTTQLHLIAQNQLAEPLDRFVRAGRPVLATCAGLILAARRVEDPPQKSFGWLDVVVRRNGWGRQTDSFEAVADDGVTPLCFIRAPRILEVGRGVEVLATLSGEPVLVRAGRFVGATHHAELTELRKDWFS